ncbi:MAG: cell division protein FtsQ/DivIB [Alphaproteobacteria bacterium]
MATKAKSKTTRKSSGTRKSTLKAKAKTKTRSVHVKALAGLWLRRVAAVVCICVLLLWLGSWFVLSNAHLASLGWAREKILSVTADMGFRVDNILVDGRHYSDPDALMAVINIEKGDSLFSFDPHGAKAQIEKIGWVRSVVVQRRFPDTIYIHLDEREPFALWQKDDALSLIDVDGQVLSQTGLDQFKNLLMVKGDGAGSRVKEILPILQAEPQIIDFIDHIERVDNRRWNLYLKQGIHIKLPEDDVGFALRHILQRHEEDGLLDSDAVVGIDARYSGRLIVRTKLGKVQDYKAQADETATPL